jgi:iron-sulfur cluster repair protein YtfE (RIC family)
LAEETCGDRSAQELHYVASEYKKHLTAQLKKLQIVQRKVRLHERQNQVVAEHDQHLRKLKDEAR